MTIEINHVIILNIFLDENAKQITMAVANFFYLSLCRVYTRGGYIYLHIACVRSRLNSYMYTYINIIIMMQEYEVKFDFM